MTERQTAKQNKLRYINERTKRIGSKDKRSYQSGSESPKREVKEKQIGPIFVQFGGNTAPNGASQGNLHYPLPTLGLSSHQHARNLRQSQEYGKGVSVPTLNMNSDRLGVATTNYTTREPVSTTSREIGS